MSHLLLTVQSITETPENYLRTIGDLFAIFDHQTQDSGNISYGVRIDDKQYFIKTAGLPDNPQPFLIHSDRVALLHNAARLAESCRHPALPRLHHTVESPHGPLLVYDWVDGELLHTGSASRDDPQSAYQRFRHLPADEILQVLDGIFELHHKLAHAGWIAVDFYDGSLIYDFERQKLHVVDLDHYHHGPFTNEMGRMFGSSRFMAPEEFELGAQIDQRTTIFTMGRTAAVLLAEGTLERQPFRGDDVLYEIIRRACHKLPDERFQSMAEFYTAWNKARSHHLTRRD